MKSISILIAAILFSSSAFAQLACLGFPSADKFDCLIKTGEVITVDIPAGFGCMQSPISGKIITKDGAITIYSPSSSLKEVNGEYLKVFNYYTDTAFGGEKIEMTCEAYQKINN